MMVENGTFSYNITGLDYETDYTAEVTTINSCGLNSQSPPTNIIIEAEGQSSAIALWWHGSMTSQPFTMTTDDSSGNAAIMAGGAAGGGILLIFIIVAVVVLVIFKVKRPNSYVHFVRNMQSYYCLIIQIQRKGEYQWSMQEYV